MQFGGSKENNGGEHGPWLIIGWVLHLENKMMRVTL